jgi:hypothetical protein
MFLVWFLSSEIGCWARSFSCPFESRGAAHDRGLDGPDVLAGEFAYDVPFWRYDAPFDDGLAELDWLMATCRQKRSSLSI